MRAFNLFAGGFLFVALIMELWRDSSARVRPRSGMRKRMPSGLISP